MSNFDLHQVSDTASAMHAHHHFEPKDLGPLNAIAFKVFHHDAASNTIIAISLVVAVTQVLIACSPALSGLPLNFFVAFAEGGMLGNIFLHMLPEIEFDTSSGLILLSGFLGFVVLEKATRILGGQSHSHSHGAHPEHRKLAETERVKESRAEKNDAKNKRSEKKSTSIRAQDHEESFNISPWLNVVADSLHNVTDGLSLAMAFRLSTVVGTSAFLIMCCHEIPHQFGDFALLIQSGASKSVARKAQLVTALGTLVGGVLGNWLGALGSYFEVLVTPLTAGVYLYVATVGVLPELLETSAETPRARITEGIVQLVGILSGIFMLRTLGSH